MLYKENNNLIMEIDSIKNINQNQLFEIEDLKNQTEHLDYKIINLQNIINGLNNDINNYKSEVQKYLFEIDIKDEKLSVLNDIMKKNSKLTSQIDEVSNLRYNINLK